MIKKCPVCGSKRITGIISIEEGKYIQKIECKRCGYVNNRDLGSAERENK